VRGRTNIPVTPRLTDEDAAGISEVGAASANGDEHAEGYYREALALARELGMRPLIAHCHLGLGKLHRRTGNPGQAQEHLTIATAMYREMDMACWLDQAAAEMHHLA
jgi:hypothetical protein